MIIPCRTLKYFTNGISIVMEYAPRNSDTQVYSYVVYEGDDALASFPVSWMNNTDMNVDNIVEWLSRAIPDCTVIHEGHARNTSFLTTSKTFYDANILECKVGTTGLRGGDGGHGAIHSIELTDLGGTCIEVKENPNGQAGVKLTFKGDSEYRTLSSALKYAAESLDELCEMATDKFAPVYSDSFHEVDNDEQ